MSDGAAERGVRVRGRALVPGLLGGVLALVTGAQPWWRASGEGVAVSFTGTETTAGLAQALGVVALAGWLLVLVLRTRGRQVVAALLVLLGAGIVLVGALRPRPSADAVRSQVREVSLADQFALRSTGWSYGYAVTGLLVTAGAVLVLVTAANWPQRADRFSRTAVPVAVLASDDPAAVWRAQDAGLDPTAGSGPGPGLDAGSVTGVTPDVHQGSIRETMGTADQAPPPRPPE
jgi:drug/metabolite transporter (DMT)-like permease